MLIRQSTTVMTTDTLTAFSTNVNLIPSGGSSPGITFPLVQGMGFVTAMYNGLTPFIESGISFQTITPLASPGYGISKYKLLLADGKTVSNWRPVLSTVFLMEGKVALVCYSYECDRAFSHHGE